MKTKYEFFISYCSHDINVVRPVVDTMITNGVSVWFAEYNISLDEWLNLTDKQIESVIMKAIEQSANVIVFSSGAWHESDWCFMEYQHARLQKARISHIALQQSPQARENIRADLEPPYQYRNPSELHKVIEHLGNEFGIELHPVINIVQSENVATIANGRRAASFDVGPLKPTNWIVYRDFGRRVRREGCDPICISMTCAFLPLRVTGDLVGRSESQLAKDSRSIANSEQDLTNDRSIYREYAHRAKHAMESTGMKVVGLHLLRSPQDPNADSRRWSGESAFAISKVALKSDNSSYMGMRTYSIRLDNSPDDRVGELLISFGIDTEQASFPIAYQTLCALGPFCDNVALSVVYHALDDSAAYEESFRRKAYLIIACIIASVAFCIQPGVAPPLMKLLAHTLGGAVGGIVLVVMSSRVLRWLSYFGLWPSFRVLRMQ